MGIRASIIELRRGAHGASVTMELDLRTFFKVKSSTFLFTAFVLTLTAAGIDDYVHVKATPTGTAERTNEYGLFTAELNMLHGLPRNSEVLITCTGGIATSYSTVGLSSACFHQCQAKKWLVGLSIAFLFMGLWLIMDVNGYAPPGIRRRLAGYCTFIAFVFLLTIVCLIGGNMNEKAHFADGGNGVLNGNDGVCAYGIDLGDAQTVSAVNSPEMGVSMILLITATVCSALASWGTLYLGSEPITMDGV